MILARKVGIGKPLGNLLLRIEIKYRHIAPKPPPQKTKRNEINFIPLPFDLRLFSYLPTIK